MDKGKESANIEGEHSQFYWVLNGTLLKYRIGFNEFVDSCNLSRQNKARLRKSEESYLPTTRVIQEVGRNLIGRIQPRDLLRVLVSPFYSREGLERAESYFQSLETVEDVRGVSYVLEKKRLSDKIMKLSEEMANLDKSC